MVPRRNRSWVSSLVGTLLLGSVAVAATPRAVIAQAVVSPDLAAMSVTPADVGSVGLPGHGWSNGILTSRTERVAEFFSFWRSESDVTAIGSALAAAQPSEVYVLHMIRPPTEGDNSDADERVVSYVMSFPDEASAASGFAAWTGAWQGRYTSASTTATVGDERFVVTGEAQEADGSRFPLVHMAFRAGPIVAGVSVEFFTGFAPEQETVEALAALQHQRIVSTLTDGGPGLPGRLVRFDVPGLSPSFAVYGIRAGQRSFRDSDTAASAAESQATATAAGIVDQFQVEQQVGGEPGATAPPYAFYSARIITFTGADAASRYTADSVARLTEGGATNLTPVNALATAGEEVSAFTYNHENDLGTVLNDYRLYARTGSTVFTFAINTTGQIDLATADAIAALQASCLVGTGSCASSFAVPAGLLP